MNRLSRILYRFVIVASVFWILFIVLFLYGAAGGDLEGYRFETLVMAAMIAVVPLPLLFAVVWAILWIFRQSRSN